MRLGRIVEALNERMSFEGGLDDSPLHAFPATVDQSHFPQARLMRGAHVLPDHGGNVSRGERVKIERCFYRNLEASVFRRKVPAGRRILFRRKAGHTMP